MVDTASPSLQWSLSLTASGKICTASSALDKGVLLYVEPVSLFLFLIKICMICMMYDPVFRRDINYFGVNVCIIEPGFFKTAVTSLDPLERELHRLWNQLSPEVQASYGDKYLDKCK